MMARTVRPWFLLLILGLALLAVSACTAMPPLFLVGEATGAQAMPAAPAAPVRVALAPTATPVVPTVAPSPTAVPPTATPLPPTATPTAVPPTATPTTEPPTATAVLPTATPEPATPTATSVPATATRAAPTRTPTKAATATARVLAARPTATRVPPTPTPRGPAELVITEAEVESLATANAVPGLQIQGLDVEFGDDVMTLGFDSLRYGFVSLRDVVVEGHFTVSNGQVTFVADRIQPRNLATNAIPGFINQALGQNLSQYYVESVRIEPDQLVATGQRR
jgi:hypothetical protein